MVIAKICTIKTRLLLISNKNTLDIPDFISLKSIVFFPFIMDQIASLIFIFGYSISPPLNISSSTNSNSCIFKLFNCSFINLSVKN